MTIKRRERCSTNNTTHAVQVPEGSLANWCLTALLAQTGYIVSSEYEVYCVCYISPLCPEVSRERILTKFGTNVSLVDVINPD